MRSGLILPVPFSESQIGKGRITGANHEEEDGFR
jgi:hypothetical protein